MPPSVELVVAARPHVVGGLTVARVLPWVHRRSVGPFVFFDHFGPVQLTSAAPFDVLPHPHIGLATVTYLYAGEVVHRDSLGSREVVRPGDVNWMSAGRGIVHSERSTDTQRAHGGPLHGLQLWVALPRAPGSAPHLHEDAEPWFEHHPAATLPELTSPGARVRVLAGALGDVRAPVTIASPLFLSDVELEAGARFALPDEHTERAVYATTGAVAIDGETHAARELLVLAPAARELRATERARVLVFGGAPLPEPRFIDWNFVASSKARITAAKAAWKTRQFPHIPGETDEFVPLPESLRE